MAEARALLDAALARMRERAPERVYSEDSEELLGMSGRMLSGTKTAPEGETIYWNACVFNDAGQQVWHGDLNLARQQEALQALADRIGTIHVTPEQPFRFDGLKEGRKRHGDRVVIVVPTPTDRGA